jgi:hypothetical protein
LRFVRKQPEQDASDPRAPVEEHQRATKQRGGEEAIVPVAEIYEYGGIGCGQQ